MSWLVLGDHTVEAYSNWADKSLICCGLQVLVMHPDITFDETESLICFLVIVMI